MNKRVLGGILIVGLIFAACTEGPRRTRSSGSGKGDGGDDNTSSTSSGDGGDIDSVTSTGGDPSSASSGSPASSSSGSPASSSSGGNGCPGGCNDFDPCTDDECIFNECTFTDNGTCPQTCDESSADCTACQMCAGGAGGPCNDELIECFQNNPDCVSLNECYGNCSDDVCTDDCKAQFPGGISDQKAAYVCLLCNNCAVTCDEPSNPNCPLGP